MADLLSTLCYNFVKGVVLRVNRNVEASLVPLLLLLPDVIFDFRERSANDVDLEADHDKQSYSSQTTLSRVALVVY